MVEGAQQQIIIDEVSLGLSIAMLIFGVLAHFLKFLIQLKRDGKRISPIKYITSNPLETSFAIIGACVGFIALLQFGKLDPVNAFGIGYMANSIADVLGGRAKGAIK